MDQGALSAVLFLECGTSVVARWFGSSWFFFAAASCRKQRRHNRLLLADELHELKPPAAGRIEQRSRF